MDELRTFVQQALQSLGPRELRNVVTLRLPLIATRACTVANRQQNSSGLAVFLIYDHYVNYESQKNVNMALTWLAMDYRLRLVCVEGAEGELDMHSQRRWASRESVKEMVEKQLRKGEIRGVEYWGLVTQEPAVLYGVDDIALHERQSEAFELQARNYEKLQWAFDALHNQVSDLKERRLSAPWKCFYEVFKSLGSGFLEVGALPIAEVFQGFAEYADDGFISLDDYPTISVFLAGLELEGFDPAQAEAERNRLLPDIATILMSPTVPGDRVARLVTAKLLADGRSPKEITAFSSDQYSQLYGEFVNALAEELARWRLLADLGQVNEVDFYDLLVDVTSLLGIDIGQYPALCRYIHHVHYAEKFNGMRLTSEAQSGLQTIKSALPTTPAEQEVVELYEMLMGLQLFCQLRLAPDDYDRLVELYGKPSFGKLLHSPLMQASLPPTTLNRLKASEKDVEQIVEAARQFYRLARMRAANLAQKTLEQMRERGESVAAIVAGGFLAGPIQAELDRNDVSFIALVPQTSTTSQQDDDIYAKLIVNR